VRVALDRLAQLARGSQPSAGATRVLALDGRSGAGKSMLARALSQQMRVPYVSMEQLYGGWSGLQDGIDRLLAEVLEPLAAGREAMVPLYDWAAARWLSPQALPPPPLLIVEGVGAGAVAAAPYLGLLAWLELSEPMRKARAMERDGTLYDGHWEMWRDQEDEYLRVNRTAERAEVILAG
jgi:hypothetical protein